MNTPTNPIHYNRYAYQPIDFMKDLLSEKEFEAYCICQVIKYISRHTQKDRVGDLKKAEYYLLELPFDIQDHMCIQDISKFTEQLSYFEKHIIENMFKNHTEAHKTLKFGIENYEEFCKF